MNLTRCIIHDSKLPIHNKYDRSLNMLETRHLLYFKTVAEHLNYTQAAKSLNMSQPPLSYQIKQLEEYLDVELFYRTNRAVELTEAGKYFYEVTVRTLNNMDNYIDTVKKIDKG